MATKEPSYPDLGSKIKSKTSKSISTPHLRKRERRRKAFVYWGTWVLVAAFVATSVLFIVGGNVQGTKPPQGKEQSESQESSDMAFYKNQVEQNPEDPLANANLGVEYIKIKNFDNAEKYLLKAVKLNPEYYYARSNLARVYAVKKNYDESIKLLLEFRQLKPDNVQVLEELCDIYYAAGKKDKVREEVEALLKKDPGSMRAYIIRGQLNQEAKDNTAAVRDYKYALDIAQVQRDYQTAMILNAAIKQIEGKVPVPSASGIDLNLTPPGPSPLKGSASAGPEKK
ncbi:MAG: tetratricopeptide repeat protein [Chloroflexi bacterium]|nr:tetratricopeptide repeat protein [Chloroflexota bacterium]